MKVIDKLHKQFAHTSSSRLLSLLKDAVLFDEDVKVIVEEISRGCNVCKRYQKMPARPVVSLPLATKFNEVVAMDLKEWKKDLYFLHLIDVATRFSLAAVIQKTPSVIIDKVVTLWVGEGFGAPMKFIADNGGEFANDEYRDVCQNLNVEVCNTA